MLGKEWLAKVDNETSTPYLLVSSFISPAQVLKTPTELGIPQKYHVDESELTCSVMITDTRSIWFESALSTPDLFWSLDLGPVM